jgi:hypothetical protein
VLANSDPHYGLLREKAPETRITRDIRSSISAVGAPAPGAANTTQEHGAATRFSEPSTQLGLDTAHVGASRAVGPVRSLCGRESKRAAAGGDISTPPTWARVERFAAWQESVQTRVEATGSV